MGQESKSLKTNELHNYFQLHGTEFRTMILHKRMITFLHKTIICRTTTFVTVLLIETDKLIRNTSHFLYTLKTVCHTYGYINRGYFLSDLMSTPGGIMSLTRASKPSASGTVTTITPGKIMLSSSFFRFLLLSHVVMLLPF